MCLGGAMTACGMLGSITSVFVRLTRRLVGMIASTVGAGLFLNLATADQYISIILTGNMFKEIYRKNGYESRLLSRTTEDAVTVTSVINSMEYLRNDTGNHSQCANTDLFALLFF